MTDIEHLYDAYLQAQAALSDAVEKAYPVGTVIRFPWVRGSTTGEVVGPGMYPYEVRVKLLRPIKKRWMNHDASPRYVCRDVSVFRLEVVTMTMVKLDAAI